MLATAPPRFTAPLPETLRMPVAFSPTSSAENVALVEAKVPPVTFITPSELAVALGAVAPSVPP